MKDVKKKVAKVVTELKKLAEKNDLTYIVMVTGKSMVKQKGDGVTMGLTYDVHGHKQLLTEGLKKCMEIESREPVINAIKEGVNGMIYESIDTAEDIEDGE